MKILSFLKQTASIFKNWSILFGKTQQLYGEELKVRLFLEHRGSLLSFKMLFTGTTEINIYFHSLSFLFAVDKPFFLINFFEFTMKPGKKIPYLSAYLTQPN